MLEYSIKNRFLVPIITAIIIFIAGIRFFEIPFTLYPLSNQAQVRVNVFNVTQSSSIFKRTFGETIERDVMGLEGVDNLKASYQEGSTQYDITFRWGVVPAAAKVLIENAISKTEGRFPIEWPKTKLLAVQDGSDNRIVVSLYSSTLSVADLERIAHNQILKNLEMIDHMDSIHVNREFLQSVEVMVDPLQLIKYNITLDTVRKALIEQSQTKNYGIVVASGGKQRNVLQINKVSDIEDLKKLIIRNANDPVRLDEVATVQLAPNPNRNVRLVGTEPRAFIWATPEPNADIRKFTADYFRELDAAIKSLNLDVKYEIQQNPLVHIKSALQDMGSSFFFGTLIAIAVTFIFLRSIPLTLITAFSIPFSLSFTLLCADLLDITINILTIGGMAVVIGMVLDSTIVVIEALVAEMKAGGVSHKAVVHSLEKMVKPIVATNLANIIVFLPLYYTLPISKAIVGEVGLIISIALATSTVYALVVAPILLIRSLKNGVQETPSTLGTKLVGFYSKILHALLTSSQWKRGFIIANVLGFAVSLYLAKSFDKEIVKKPAPSNIWVMFNLKDALGLEERKQVAAQIEARLKKIMLNESAYRYHNVSANMGFVINYLKDSSQSEKLLKLFEEEFKSDEQFSFQVFPNYPVSLNLPDYPIFDFTLKNHFNNDNDKYRKLQDVQTFLGTVPEIGRIVAAPRTSKTSYLDFSFNDAAIYLYNKKRGTAAGEILESSIRSNLSGLVGSNNLFEVYENGEKVPLRLTVKGSDEEAKDSLLYTPMKIHDRIVPMGNFIDLTYDEHYEEICTENGREIWHLQVWPSAITSHLSKSEIKEKIRSAIMKQFPDFDADFISSTEDKTITENVRSLIIAFIVSLFLIIAILLILYQRVSYMLIIMSSIPTGVIGAFFSMKFFDITLNVNSILGLIILAGSAVNNSIIYIDQYIHNAESGEDGIHIVVKTAVQRGKSLLMATLSTVFGMIPLAIGIGPNGHIMNDLGITLGTGLLFSTIVTFFLVPVLLSYIYPKTTEAL